jgi:hypothetical protein
MSANECMDTVRECLQNGASHYIVKPATHKEIQNIWQYAFRGAASSPDDAQPRQTHSDKAASLAVSNNLRCATPSIAVREHPPEQVPAMPEPAQPQPMDNMLEGYLSLNTILESKYLPWRTRLAIFCRLLHSTRHALDTATAAPGPSAESRAQHLVFVNPAAILIEPSGRVAPCTAPPAHFSSALYQPPPVQMHQSAQGQACEAAQATYALGLLLLELAMAPSTPRERAGHLAMLPRLPAQLLSSKPQVCVLILQMVRCMHGLCSGLLTQNAPLRLGCPTP